jgi:RES domain-containing protein
VAYNLDDPGLWTVLGAVNLFRVLDAAAAYAPDDPFASTGGRFSDGTRKVLYLAASPEGAVAEWLRHHPEFLLMQDALRVRVSSVGVDVPAQLTLDVRTKAQAERIPFPFERLRSSDADEDVRYAECRELALDSEGSAGIAFPSAAYGADGAWNVVLVGEQGDRWVSTGHAAVDRPEVPPHLVQLIEPA